MGKVPLQCPMQVADLNEGWFLVGRGLSQKVPPKISPSESLVPLQSPVLGGEFKRRLHGLSRGAWSFWKLGFTAVTTSDRRRI